MKSIETSKNSPPLIVVVGQTASGKSAVCLDLAKKIGGEIICADSRTIYKEMNIGTAKPTKKDRSEIAHWCLDLVNPDELFTVADFQKEANRAISDIQARGKIPIMVGGSGLYVDSVVFDFKLRSEADQKERQKLERLSTDELQDYCKKYNYPLPENKLNRRYLIRTIETKGNVVKNNAMRPGVIMIGIDVEKTMLYKRVSQRIIEMVNEGIIQETSELYKKYNSKFESMKANIYSIVKRFIDREINQDEMIKLAIVRDMQLAKKQRTWFKRNPNIVWLKASDIEAYVLSKLPKNSVKL